MPRQHFKFAIFGGANVLSCRGTEHKSVMASSLQFWKPGTQGPGSSLDRATESEETIVHALPSSSSLGIQAQRERLPIFKHSSFVFLAYIIFPNDRLLRREAVVLYRTIWRGRCRG